MARRDLDALRAAVAELLAADDACEGLRSQGKLDSAVVRAFGRRDMALDALRRLLDGGTP